jgi:polysaccharide export outer membrane protein
MRSVSNGADSAGPTGCGVGLCRVAGIALAAAIVSSCAGDLPDAALSPVPAYQQETGPSSFVFSWGDQVEVKFHTHPELNEIQHIRPDGYITIQLLGDVRAAGSTPEQLRMEILRRGQGILIAPQIAVIPRELNSMRVMVGGQVLRTGSISLNRPMTIMEAVFQAGGPDMTTAAVDSVVVLRQLPKKDAERLGAMAGLPAAAAPARHPADGRKTAVSFVLNGEHMLSLGFLYDMSGPLQGRLSLPVYVHPGDIIFVPRTRIVRLNTWIDQYFNMLIPGATFTRTIDDTTFGINLRP